MTEETSVIMENVAQMEDKVDIKIETNELTTEIKFETDNTDVKNDNPFQDVQLEVKEELQEEEYAKDVGETKDTEAKDIEMTEPKTEEFSLKLEIEQEALSEESQDEGSMDSNDVVALHNVEACLEDEEIKTEDNVGEETHAAARATAAAAPAIRSLIANENVEELIDEVEKRPALYKKDMKQYSDINLKEKLWEEVCAVVINNWSKLNAYEKREKGREVKKKWNNLRTCFARELKAQKLVKSGKAASKRRPYVYFERMLFLLPCMESRPTGGSNETSESNQNDTDLSEEAQPHRQRKRKAKRGEFKEQLLNAHHSKEQLSNAHHSKEQLLNAHHAKEQLLNAHHSTEQLLNAHHSTEQSLNAHHSKEQLLNAHHSKEDADTNYCLSLVPFMKELTADEKLEVRIHILKMFQDIKKKRQFQNNISFIQPDTSQPQVTRQSTPSTQIIKSKHSRSSRPSHTTNQTFTSQPLPASQVSQQQYNITESYLLTSPSSESQTPPPPQYDSDIIQYWPNYSESD